MTSAILGAARRGRSNRRPRGILPPSNWYTGMPAWRPLMSQSAWSTPLMALLSTGPLRQ